MFLITEQSTVTVHVMLSACTSQFENPNTHTGKLDVLQSRSQVVWVCFTLETFFTASFNRNQSSHSGIKINFNSETWLGLLFNSESGLHFICIPLSGLCAVSPFNKPQIMVLESLKSCKWLNLNALPFLCLLFDVRDQGWWFFKKIYNRCESAAFRHIYSVNC